MSPGRKRSRVVLCSLLGCGGMLLLFTLMAAFFSLRGGKSLDTFARNKIGLIYVEGIIVGGKGGRGGGLMGGATFTGSEDIVKLIKRAEEDESIKAVVLRVNSPGGSAAGSQEIYDAVMEIKKRNKTVVVSMADLAASGGYYISSPAHFIVANPATFTGSIGVIMEHQNLKELLGKIGVEVETLKSGANKDLGSPFRKINSGERKILMALLTDVHDQFIQAVAKGRRLDVGFVRKVGDGRVYTGRQAKVLKLVDALGNLEFAVQKAKELAGIPGKPSVVELSKPASPWDFLLGSASKTGSLLRMTELLRLSDRFLSINYSLR